MDINLPGMNGVECVRKLKQVAPEIMVVMLTAYEDTENIFIIKLCRLLPLATCLNARRAPNYSMPSAKFARAVRP